jgi:hypothetical protein
MATDCKLIRTAERSALTPGTKPAAELYCMYKQELCQGLSNSWLLRLEHTDCKVASHCNVSI